MSFKNDVLDLLGYILKEQKATRHAILHQTKLLLKNKENPTSSNEETNKPEEEAPAPKAITWQEAVMTLRDICQGQDCCDDCVAREWCDKALPFNMAVITPNYWEVPGDE